MKISSFLLACTVGATIVSAAPRFRFPRPSSPSSAELGNAARTLPQEPSDPSLKPRGQSLSQNDEDDEKTMSQRGYNTALEQCRAKKWSYKDCHRYLENNIGKWKEKQYLTEAEIKVFQEEVARMKKKEE